MTEGNRGRQAQAEIQAAISGAQGPAQIGPTVGAGLTFVGAGGYRFDPDQMAAVISKWEELKEDLDADYAQLSSALQACQPPSMDQPAVANTRAVYASVQAAMNHNRSMWDYARRWVDNLRKANGTYREQEDHTGTGLYGNGADTSGKGLYG